MRPNQHFGRLRLDPPREEERRRYGRLRTEDVTCSIGEVVDLSPGGMKVRRKGWRCVRVGDRFTLTLRYGGFALPLDVRVVRLERHGFRRHCFGLAFEEVNPDIRSKITHLARIAAYHRALPT
ncbi:MAG: PilZ domain-containing protein [Phycisphaeraceae bacterium]